MRKVDLYGTGKTKSTKKATSPQKKVVSKKKATTTVSPRPTYPADLRSGGRTKELTGTTTWSGDFIEPTYGYTSSGDYIRPPLTMSRSKKTNIAKSTAMKKASRSVKKI